MAPLDLHEAFDTEAETTSLLERQFSDILERFPYTSEQVYSIKSNIAFLVNIFDGVSEEQQEKINALLVYLKDKLNEGEDISNVDYLSRLDVLGELSSSIKNEITTKIFDEIENLSLSSTSTTEVSAVEETPGTFVSESETPVVTEEDSSLISGLTGGLVESESSSLEATAPEAPEVPEVTPVAPTETLIPTAFEDVKNTLSQFKLYLDTTQSQYTGNDLANAGYISTFVQGLIDEIGVNFPQKMAYPEFAERFTADIAILKSIVTQIQEGIKISEIELDGNTGSEMGEFLRNAERKRTEIRGETERRLQEAKGDIYNSLGDMLVDFEDGTMMSIEDPVLIEYLRIIKSIEENTDHKSIINEGQGLELPETGMSILSRVSIGSEKFLDSVEYSDEDFNILIDRMLDTDDGFYKLLVQRYGTNDKEIIRNKFRGELQLQTPQTINEGEVLKTAESVLRNNFTQLQGQLGDGGTMMVLNGKNIGPFSNTLERDQNILQILYFYKGLLEDPNQLKSFGEWILKTTNFILRVKGLGIPWAIEKLVGFIGSDSLESVIASIISTSAIGMVGLGFYSKRMRIVGTSLEPGRILEGINRRLVLAPIRINRAAESALLPKGTEIGLLQRYKDLLKKDKNPDGSMTDEVRTGLQALEEEFKKFKTGTNLEDLVKRDIIFTNLLELHKNNPKVVVQIQELYNNIRLYQNKNVFYSTLFTEYQTIIGARSRLNNIGRGLSNFLATGFIETLEVRTGGQINVAWIREKFQNGNPFILRSELTRPEYTRPAVQIFGRTIRQEQIVPERTRGEISIQRSNFEGSFENYFDKITSQGFLISIDNSKIIPSTFKTDIHEAVRVESEKPAGGMQLQEIRSAFEGINGQLKGIQERIISTDGNPIASIYKDAYELKITDLLNLNIISQKDKGLSKGKLTDLKKGLKELVDEIPVIEKIYVGIQKPEFDYIKSTLKPKIEESIGISGDKKIEEYARLFSPGEATGTPGLVIEVHEKYRGDNFFKGELAKILSDGNNMQNALENLRDTGKGLSGLFKKFEGINSGTELTQTQKEVLFNRKFSTEDIKNLDELFDNMSYREIKIFALKDGEINISFLNSFLSHRRELGGLDPSKLPKGQSLNDVIGRMRVDFISSIQSGVTPTPIIPPAPATETPPINQNPADFLPETDRVTPEGVEILSLQEQKTDYLRRVRTEILLEHGALEGFNTGHYRTAAYNDQVSMDAFTTQISRALNEKGVPLDSIRSWDDMLPDLLDSDGVIQRDLIFSSPRSLAPDIQSELATIRRTSDGVIDPETRARFRDIIIRAFRTGA